MKIAISLALVATISQTLSVLAAPPQATTHRLSPFILPEKVNLEGYHEAILHANSITPADIVSTRAQNARGGVSAQTAGRDVITLICVAVAHNPLRTHIFTNVHGCTRQGWTEFYAFTSYSTKNAIATKPWVACTSKSGGHVIQFSSRCSYGTKVTSGYANDRDTGNESFIMTSPDGYMYMQPFWSDDFVSDKRNFTNAGSIKNLGVFNFPIQPEIDLITKHVNDYPDLYRRTSEYNTFSKEVARAAEVFVSNLPTLDLTQNQGEWEVAPGTGYTADLQTLGYQGYANRFSARVSASFKGADGALRRTVNVHFQGTNSQWKWMGGVTALTNRSYDANVVRATLTEAIRDHTTAPILPSPYDTWMITPLPRFVHGTLPDIPIYSMGIVHPEEPTQ